MPIFTTTRLSYVRSRHSLRPRHRRAWLHIVCFSVGMLLAGAVSAMGKSHNKPAGPFTRHSLDGWTERSFDGNTQYKLVDDRGTRVLRGHTKGQASILFHKRIVDIRSTPIMHWSWKVDRTYTGIDEHSREGDDFPARLYVVAQTGFLPWETVAINYVWASTTPVGESWINPFTKKAIMVAVQSGDNHVGTWVSHSRDVAADFKRLFNIDIDKLSGYAVMVDGDNSNKEATAWFGEIKFSPG